MLQVGTSVIAAQPHKNEEWTLIIMTATRQPGEVRLLALRNTPREYIIEEINPEDQQEGIQAAVEFVREAGGGALYKLEYYEDKYKHVIPKCERLGVVWTQTV
jgi:hypothetical protein